MTIRPIVSASARWNNDNVEEGWVVTVRYLSGESEELPPAPSVFHEPKGADRNHIVRETMNHEALEWYKPEGYWLNGRLVQ